MGLDVLRWGGDRLRAGPWRGNAHIAYIAPHPTGPAPTTESVRRTCAVLAKRGFREAVTAALGPAESQGFITAGFTVREHLHLLAHDMRRLSVVPPGAPLRRGRRTDRGPALAVDAAAFDAFWCLDGAGLDEAIAATPANRFRVADTGHVVGYAVTGRAGDRGFLQRLAVTPAEEGGGLGAALALDALRWLHRRGVVHTVVNTQERNARALALYERLGFRRQPGGLAVLHAPLA
ncbi:MAG: GNAT family N-acetyltransferase [Acidimicrobiales bacterium]